MTRYLRFILLFTTVCIPLGLATLTPAADAPITQIAVLPFNTHANSDISFLQRGAMEMLTARLTEPGKLVAIQTDVPDTQSAADIASQTGSDYVVKGSITAMQNGVGTSAQLIDAAGEILVSFSQNGTSTSDILNHLDAFAKQVKTYLAKRAAQASVPATGAVAIPVIVEPAPAQPAPAMAETPAPAPAPAAAAAPAAAKPEITHSAVWKSRRMNQQFKGLAAADFSGDGANEIACLTDYDVTVYRFADGRLSQTTTYRSPKYTRHLAIDAADLDGNSQAEIYVTSLDTRTNRLASFVLECSQGQCRPILDNQNRYFRVIQTPSDNSAQLVGQGRGLIEGDNSFGIYAKRDLFSGPVYQLHWKDGQLVEGQPVGLPGWAGIFGFNYGDFGPNSHALAAFTRDKLLRLENEQGEKIWAGPKAFGGTNIFLKLPTAMNDETARFYLPQRVLIADIDQDGTQEIIVARNHSVSLELLAKVRYFNSGQMVCLGWRDISIAPLWESDELSDYLADYAIADIDNDGNPELVAALITQEAYGLKSASSFIVTWKLASMALGAP